MYAMYTHCSHAVLYLVGTEVKELSPPVVLALPRQDYATSVPRVKAVYWDSSKAMWKTDGCRISNTVEQTMHNLSIVECDHLTSFSLLQVTYYGPLPSAYGVNKICRFML